MHNRLVLLYVLLIGFILLSLFCFKHQFREALLSDSREEDPYAALREPLETDISDVPDKLEIDLSALAAINADLKGWLLIPDTPVSYPVVLGNDNEFYLHNSFYGRRSAYGCLFFDTRSVDGAKNSVIYGHNMGIRRDEMFSSLVNYQAPDYASSHKYIYFTDLADNTSVYEVFAVVNFDTRQIAAFDFRTPAFKDEDEYTAFVSQLRQRSVYSPRYLPQSEELLLLSTCNRRYGPDNRLLICCGKIR